LTSRTAAALGRFSPSRLDAAARQRLDRLLALLVGYRRRMWRRRAAQRLIWAIATGLPLAALIVLAVRAALVEQEHDLGLASVALVLLAAAGVWIVGHRVAWFDVARRVDRSGDGSDRAATALELATAERANPWVHIQARAANRWAEGLTPAGLLPFTRPEGVAWVLLGVALVVGAAMAPLTWLTPSGHGAGQLQGLALWLPPPPAAFTSAAELLGADAIDLIRADAELLARVEEQLPHGPTRVWVGDVKKVLQEVERGALDKNDALERLAALESQRPAEDVAQDGKAGEAGGRPGAEPEKKASDSPDAAADGKSEQEAGKGEAGQDADRAVRGAVARALDKSLESAPAGALRDALRKAAQKKDLDGISKWLAKLAERNMSDKELDKWVKVAERFAGQLADRKVPKQFEKLAKRVRRLQSKRKRQGGLNAGDRRRLRSTRHALQQLRREHGDVDSAKHRLQRLERNAKSAANELRRSRRSRLAKGASKAQRAQDEARRRRARGRKFRKRMRQAADEMRREGSRQKQRHARRIGRARLRDLREALGRSQRNSRAQRQFERRAGSRRSTAEARAKERKAKGGGQRKAGDRMRQASQGGRKAAEKAARDKRMAQGQQQSGQSAKSSRRKGAGAGRRKAGGQGGGVKLGQGQMSGQTRMRMMRAQAKSGGDSPEGGQGVGSESGGPNKGKRSGLRAGRTEKLQGIHGKGPTVKQTFLEAARRGFARRNWRHVYSDYSAVAQEMMDKETLPAGRKAMVRRYFELIRPR